MHTIRVGKQQPLPGSLYSAHRDGVILPYPTAWQRVYVNDAQLRNSRRKARKLDASAIGGLVINHNDFDNFRLRCQRLDSRRNGSFLIARRDDSRNKWHTL